MSTSPFDHVKMLFAHEHTDDLTGYDPFVINKALSFTPDLLFYANEMNLNYNIDTQLQYDYYFNSIRKGKRYYTWIKSPKPTADQEAVSEYFGYNNQKANEALAILDKTQLDTIKTHLIKGGPI